MQKNKKKTEKKKVLRQLLYSIYRSTMHSVLQPNDHTFGGMPAVMYVPPQSEIFRPAPQHTNQVNKLLSVEPYLRFLTHPICNSLRRGN